MNQELQKKLSMLKESTTFYMSLGSKELFHSNFLHWLSIVDYKVFLDVMHKLANKDKFWWESEDCKVEGYEGKYSVDNKNVEIRREFHHFDLSIYILVDENTKIERKGQKWIPVLVLENKVKSIPYKEQLELYQKNALNEWRIKDKDKGGEITFILLTLWKEIVDILPSNNSTEGGVFKYEWVHRKYDDLKRVLENQKTVTWRDLDNQLLSDYIRFISCLSTLANDYWKLSPEDKWERVCLWYADGKEEITEYENLRIFDLVEKIHYEQLLQFLANSLNNKNINYTFDKNQFKSGEYFLCESGFSHNVGLFQACFKQGNDTYIIQIQGDRYCRGYVSETKPTEQLQENFFMRKQTGSPFFNFSTKNNGEFYSYKDKNPNKKFYYAKADITKNITIKKVIESICDDLSLIKEFGR